ncbi:hypothetical protein ACTMTF_31970 [Nonomuraea sp. ZG12]|uniref:hypothetical protein n=1 Tax=Nonomuraea sp. ZG12 TaxID=3452207 RepID=UPI003F8CAC55
MVLFLDSERRLRRPLRLLLYFVVYFVIVAGLQAVPFPAAVRKPAFLLLVVPAIAGVTWAFRRWLDRRPWDDVGLLRPGAGGLISGCLAGIGLAGMVALVGWSAGWRDTVVGGDPWSAGIRGCS